MKSFPERFLLAAAIVLLASLAVPQAHTQTEQAQSVSAQRANEGQIPASGAVTTQDVKAFSGFVMKDNNAVTLQDSVTKVSYRLSDPAKAKPYVGKRVKVTGKLDTDNNTILMEGIEPIS
jgi:uncharacterized protein (DUF2141 family)